MVWGVFNGALDFGAISVFLFIGVIDMILVSMEGLKGRVFFRH